MYVSMYTNMHINIHTRSRSRTYVDMYVCVRNNCVCDLQKEYTKLFTGQKIEAITIHCSE